MTIQVQSFLNSATKLSTTATTATTVAQLKTLVNAIEGVSTSVMEFYIVNPSTTATVLVSGTLGSYGITTATTIYSSNIISALTIPTGLTATGYTQASSYLVAVGTFNYDAYGNGFAIRKDSGVIDAYMAQVIALGAGARNWTFVPSNGQPSFTRSMTQPDGTNTSNDPSESGVAIWNVTTANSQALAGAGAGQLNTLLIPNGTSFVIYATELGGSGGADKVGKQQAKLELAQLRRQAGGDTSSTFYRSRNIYDIDSLADKYTSNTTTVMTTSTLVEGRPWATVYTGLIFNYGQATISFSLSGRTFSNVTCPYGAGGYSASSGQIVMPGNQLIGGTTPANDIVWNYVCAANNGVITGFTYSSGTPP